MRDRPANFPASVFARLRNIARHKQTDNQLILRRYAIERLLYRLSISPHRDQFILKGAMLFTAWLDDPFRPTQDLDLLGFGNPAVTAIRAVFETICRIEAEDDGLVFDADGLSVEPIREDLQYGGVRVKTTAFLGRTRIPVQVDIGFGDAVTPAVQELEFPSLLSAERPLLRAYPRETVVAEKLQAIVALGQANSRMKDFYDLLALSRLFAFEGRSLTPAIRATFARRDTPLPTDTPLGLSIAFAEDGEKARQWSAFVGREPLLLRPSDFPATIISIAEFLLPPLEAEASGHSFERLWPAGGPWT
ncbi:nucleotidyl transferase AbiEii/AbiGii toxin family protein [Mesorhizobium sp. M1D.F.Ca.ET.043.01.1.1]|uniref:nucleotidyl transferase AbiEii/AbiGii toxin family protein n=1 Tax=Mesorhizobium sp. M1D.F.Ca.ET.043.01.1.1 TaxID=2493669 RepID=UPI000F7658BF|nr:nucleotidyl transferase AbiEii/AbiGii toxin family protein [Mesorhizobium sp. M1D.F.Ca.ET.043.01.1.1]AZO73521.1 nucleotidyl transferase AbiEii/AbiGii toxin family protein [Mesorhizobium sp. M1D.F.Ca.ET.043.01.1.1]